MILSLIVAVAKNNVIGSDNKLLWHMPADLKHFKSITMGCPVIMGRKTYESIGKPLPGRTNIVVTRTDGFTARGCTIANSLQEAVDLCESDKEVFIIGGGEVYRQAIHAADKIYLTRIDGEFEGDAVFPELSTSDWKLTKYVKHHADDKNPFNYTFTEYERHR
jgi:dihydrofolate reductase